MANEGRSSTIVIDVFSNDDMESYREHANWRSDLKRYNIIKPKRTLRQALDHVPSGLQKEEWHWLITEIYSKDPHRKASARNSANRANYKKERLDREGTYIRILLVGWGELPNYNIGRIPKGARGLKEWAMITLSHPYPHTLPVHLGLTHPLSSSKE
ncbi:hypothetical protein Cgig2_024995 [Carnegiea gigantea]|uniref:Uncharacterized protein n=1 Tax=Carnegiea gigantea TaxID=171969 RepID=A0A9Q1JRH0_9CARY|nr:hypothetical protein Cgig2_024995 [Carnegiea gigantea]